MSRHSRMFRRGVIAGAVLLGGVSVSALAQRAAAPPDFAPSADIGWYNYGRQFMPP